MKKITVMVCINDPKNGRLSDHIDGFDVVMPYKHSFVSVLSLANPFDRASFKFALQPDHVAISKSEVVTAMMAMRATGKVYYDGRLDLMVNAGAMEKVQAELGPIGELFGTLSDKLVQYQVTGRVGQPEIAVRALGG